MKEEFQDLRAVRGEVIFPIPDLSEPILPEIFVVLDRRWQLLCLQYLRMDPHNKNFLVMRAVEDAYPTTLRKCLLTSPKKVVVTLFGRRLLERDDLAALWIDPTHYVCDRSVLAGGIHCLKNDQKRICVICVQ